MLNWLRKSWFVAVIMALTFVYGSYPFVLSFERSQDHQAAQAQGAESSQKYVDPRTPDERLADYTLWLERFTGALVIVSVLQMFFLLRSDKTAREAANAAKKSADALPNIERAHLFYVLSDWNCDPDAHTMSERKTKESTGENCPPAASS